MSRKPSVHSANIFLPGCLGPVRRDVMLADEVEDYLAALAPAAVAVVAVQSCKLGNYGAAFDMPGDRRAFTYTHQPGNVGASRLGRAVAVAQTMPAGDSIDAGLRLLKALQDEGFGVFEIDIARLNRRAIPEGLIEASRRAADILGSQGFAAWDQLAAELRALLGKEGER